MNLWGSSLFLVTVDSVLVVAQIAFAAGQMQEELRVQSGLAESMCTADQPALQITQRF